MMWRGSINVNSKRKLDKIKECARREGRRCFYEVFYDNEKTFYWIFYEVKH